MYRYRITVEALSENTVQRELKFDVENHDDITAVAQRLEGKVELDHDATLALAVGMKLFGEIILKNRDNSLFSPMKAAFGEFMRTLKQQL